MATKPRGGGAKGLSGWATKKRTFIAASQISTEFRKNREIPNVKYTQQTSRTNDYSAFGIKKYSKYFFINF